MDSWCNFFLVITLTLIFFFQLIGLSTLFLLTCGGINPFLFLIYWRASLGSRSCTSNIVRIRSCKQCLSFTIHTHTKQPPFINWYNSKIHWQGILSSIPSTTHWGTLPCYIGYANKGVFEIVKFQLKVEVD